MKQALATAQAPAAIGPYSQGIAAGQNLFSSCCLYHITFVCY